MTAAPLTLDAVLSRAAEHYAGAIVTPTTGNKKTGNVPTMAIGASRAESMQTCSDVGCARLADGSCYAQFGSVSWGHRSSIAKNERQGLDRGTPAAAVAAVDGRDRGARMVRIGSIGEPAHVRRDTLWAFVDAARAAALDVVGYTHGWRDSAAQDLRGLLMASCETLADADAAIDAGWRAAVTVASDAPRRLQTPAGRTVLVCPNQVTNGAVTCNACRMCKSGGPADTVIAFRGHGSKSASIATV